MDPKGVVFEGRTLDDAVSKGLAALKLSRAEVMITVLEEGSGGFLGIGARPYRVRMMPRPRREFADRERRGDRPERGQRRERRGGERGDRERGDRDRGRPERGRREPQQARNGRAAPRPQRPVADAPRERRSPEGPREADADRQRRRRRRSGRGRPGETRVEGAAPGPAVREHRPERHAAGEPATMAAVREESFPPEGPAMSPEELTGRVQKLADDLFNAMGFEARVSVQTEEEDSIAVRAEVPNGGELLTGEKGEVRQALQHLLNRMLNRGQNSRYHIQLEINDFWRQRETELRDLALRLAEEAVADQRERLTEYLNAQERRIVHVTLREDTRVRTYAIGEGLIKKVAIAPAEASEELKPEE